MSDLSQFLQPTSSEVLKFNFDNEQHVIVAVEIWRRTEKGMFKFVDLKPYYKFEVDTKVLSQEELTRLHEDEAVGAVTEPDKSMRYLSKNLVSNPFTNSYEQNTLLGVQIDESSRYGVKIEITFSDYERLLYKIVRTDDVIFVWTQNLSKTLASAAISGADFAASKLLFYEMYNQDVKYAVGVKDFLTKKKIGTNLQNVSITNTSLIGTLCKSGEKEQKIKKSRFTTRIERDRPHFSGFITVKNLHMGGSTQLRMNAQDPARMFQHLKINYGIKKEDNDNNEAYTLKDYDKNTLWQTTISKAVKFCINNGMTTSVLPATEVDDPDNRGRTMKKFMITSSRFFAAFGDRVFAETRRVQENETDKLLISFDKIIMNLFGKIKKDGSGKISFLVADKGGKAEQFYLYLDDKSGKASGTIPLARALTNVLNVRTSERWTPDKLDLYTRPELDTTFNTPSIIDFVNMYLSNFIYINKIIYGDASKNLWVKSDMFINQDVPNRKKGTGIVICLLFTFSGRDAAGNLLVPDRKHKLYLDEVSEIDIFEVNRRGQIAECHLVDPDDVNSAPIMSVSLKNNFSTKNNIYSNVPKMVVFETQKPLVDYKESTVNTSSVSLEDGYYLELREKVDNMLSYTQGVSVTSNNPITDTLNSYGINPKTFELEFNLNGLFGSFSSIAVPISEKIKQTGTFNIKYSSSKTFQLKEKYSYNEFFEMCQDFLSDSSLESIGQTVFGVSKDIDYHIKNTYLTAKSIGKSSLNAVTQVMKSIYQYLDDADDTLRFLSEVVKYNATEISDYQVGQEPYYEFVRNITQKAIPIKKFMVALIFGIIEMTCKTVETMLIELATMQGRNGSIYMGARPNIQVGDTIFLQEKREGFANYYLEKLSKRVAPVDIIDTDRVVSIASAAIGKTKEFTSMLNEKKYIRDLENNGEGSAFIDDDIVKLNTAKENEVVRWFVYRHVQYIGNFGTTSGFMSKIYLVDDPINSNMPFDEDNVITRQLSTFLQRSSLSENLPLSWKRMV